MADPISPVPDLSQFNYAIGDTVEVVTKQNGVNAAIDNLVVDINSTIDSINDDVDFFTTARDEIDAANIVHAPGSGLANEAGTAYSEDAQTTTYDATAGRLTKVGAFGGYGRLSSESLNVYPLTDMNSNPNTVRSGRYSVSNLSGTLNMPFPTAPPDAFGVVEVIPQDANNRVILKATDGGDLSLNGAGDVYERIWWLGSWTTPWRKVGEAKYRDVVGGSSGSPVMAEGAFGFGAVSDDPSIFNGDLNTVVNINGKWAVNGTFNGLPTGSSGNGILSQDVNITSGSSRIHQTFKRTNDQSLEERYRTYQRYYLQSVGWTPWTFLYNSQNIVGTVTQSGGLPTGAIVERGSNSNGEWVKYADGTLIMTSSESFTGIAVIVLEGGWYRSSENQIVLPLGASDFVGASTTFTISLQSGSGDLLTSTIGRTRRSGSSLFFTLLKGASTPSVSFEVVATVNSRWY